MGSSSAPKPEPVAAAARQSTLDIKRAQNDSQRDLLARFGAAQTTKAGETGSLLG